MNKIEARYFKTKYWSVEHPCIFIDGERLDEMMDRICPNKKFLGLIPTLFSALQSQEQVDVVWDRVLPASGQAILPILMCPDDVDLYCTLIVTQVLVREKTVLWEHFGLDQSYSTEYIPNWIGSEVEWIENSLCFEFNKIEYQKMINVFVDERKVKYNCITENLPNQNAARDATHP